MQHDGKKEMCKVNRVTLQSEGQALEDRVDWEAKQ